MNLYQEILSSNEEDLWVNEFHLMPNTYNNSNEFTQSLMKKSKYELYKEICTFLLG